ncbi:hypothetical protein KAR91_79270 [Candidatus Pacearchaeota archaeon]|nr:hypothetical protein [Candidatus Pacearchaeota archaeon]
MADKKISELVANTAVAANDVLVIVKDSGGTNAKITASDFFTVTIPLQANNLILTDLSTPANSTQTAVQGNFFFDDDFLYIATATNVLKRVALSSF